MQIMFKESGRRWDDDDLLTSGIAQNFAWTGREDYLEWVASWKTELARRIARIRALKAIRRDKSNSLEARNSANLSRQFERIQCHNLLMLRIKGKEESRRQRDHRRRVDAASATA